MHFEFALEDPEFVKENELYNNVEVEGKPLDIEIPKLRNKYNNLKKGWRAMVDRAKNGSGLHVERQPKWFQILHRSSATRIPIALHICIKLNLLGTVKLNLTSLK